MGLQGAEKTFKKEKKGKATDLTLKKLLTGGKS